MDVHGRGDLADRIRDRGGNRVEPLRKLVLGPGVPFDLNLAKLVAQPRRLHHGTRCVSLDRMRQEAVHTGGCQMGQEDLPGGHRVHRQARARPVAYQDLVSGLHLIDIVDDEAVRH